MDLARKYSDGQDNDLNQDLLFYSAFPLLLFSAAAEDQTLIGQGAYDVPSHGSFVYYGLQGLIPLLLKELEKTMINLDKEAQLAMDLAPCQLADYMVNRLRKRSGEFKELAEICSKIFEFSPAIPYCPCYFEALVGDKFLSLLMDYHISRPSVEETGAETHSLLYPAVCLFLGDSKKCSKQLKEGKGARYNCRDATWFWLYAIVRYAHMAPDGEAILKESVLRVFSTDDAEFMVDSRVESLADAVTEALQRHFLGIDYRERNTGAANDEYMKDEVLTFEDG
ncbi:unnamed protein product, partial [Mesorhabditis belari]|uniref:Uncharacterized protein n=1 Tax=Mesorhabditis belari TaxID=2138241 RepID=A0AAF3J5S2_9BILA